MSRSPRIDRLKSYLTRLAGYLGQADRDEPLPSDVISSDCSYSNDDGSPGGRIFMTQKYFDDGGYSAC